MGVDDAAFDTHQHSGGQVVTLDGWYRGTGTGKSCFGLCSDAGKQCKDNPTANVDSEIKFNAVNTAVKTTAGAVLPFVCASIEGSAENKMPGMNKNDNKCYFKTGGSKSGCGNNEDSVLRMCCCTGAGENWENVCGVEAP